MLRAENRVKPKKLFLVFNALNQSLRRHNYPLYRFIVENKIVYKLISLFFSKNRCYVTTPENYQMAVNPLYHSQFLPAGALGHYEENVRGALSMLIKPGMVVYDVGANVGVFALQCAFLLGDAGKIVAFEPEENNYLCLKQTKERNELRNLEIVFSCVADSSGTQLFDHRGGAFSGRIIEASSSVTHTVCQKATVSLDDFVNTLKHEAPDLVKIDVEGNEYLVLQGMGAIMRAHFPIIICELHKNLCDSIPEIFNMLRENGYFCYDVDEFVQGKRPVLADFGSTGHIIAIKKVN